jgi:hypothetical protein
MIINVIRRRVSFRVTPNIRRSLPLIHPHVIHQHLRREHHSRQVDRLSIRYARHQHTRQQRRMPPKKKKHLPDMPRFNTMELGSSGIGRCPTPVPLGPWLGPTDVASRRALCWPSTIHLMKPSSGFEGFAQYSKAASKGYIHKLVAIAEEMGREHTHIN